MRPSSHCSLLFLINGFMSNGLLGRCGSSLKCLTRAASKMAAAAFPGSDSPNNPPKITRIKSHPFKTKAWLMVLSCFIWNPLNIFWRTGRFFGARTLIRPLGHTVLDNKVFVLFLLFLYSIYLTKNTFCYCFERKRPQPKSWQRNSNKFKSLLTSCWRRTTRCKNSMLTIWV